MIFGGYINFASNIELMEELYDGQDEDGKTDNDKEGGAVETTRTSLGAAKIDLMALMKKGLAKKKEAHEDEYGECFENF